MMVRVLLRDSLHVLGAVHCTADNDLKSLLIYFTVTVGTHVRMWWRELKKWLMAESLSNFILHVSMALTSITRICTMSVTIEILGLKISGHNVSVVQLAAGIAPKIHRPKNAQVGHTT